MLPKQIYFEQVAKKVISSLEKRNMKGVYFANKEEAVQYILDTVQKNSVVSWGGSMTLQEIGLIDELNKGDYELLDRSKANTPEEVTEIYHKALSADYYLMSTNAITQDGKLINIDGNGNRIAALIYGPKEVIVVAGMNKVAKDEEQGMQRVRNYASPINAIRLSQPTPCAATGTCHDCNSPQCICCQVLVTRHSRHNDRITVVLIGEELGY